jgi:hypothetical protein
MKLYGDVVDQYRDFAFYAADESPCFETWARGVADDPELVALISTLPPVKQQPNLVFAAARWHGVAAPAPFAALRDALHQDWDTIRGTILTRATQTNEVGRLATLLPAFALLAARDPRPLALLEVGASAGLCLYPDRYDYRWSTTSGERRAVTSSPGGGELRCQVTGPAPLPEHPPRIGWRGGLDLSPLDVNDDDAMAWLTNLVWPEQEDRRERLRAAIEVAREDPPRLVTGDLLVSLPELIATIPAGHTVVVFHSAVAAYLEPPDRSRFFTSMTGLVGEGACHWVSNEGENVLPEITRTEADAGQDGLPFVLAVNGQAVARTHGHGRMLAWRA